MWGQEHLGRRNVQVEVQRVGRVCLTEWKGARGGLRSRPRQGGSRASKALHLAEAAVGFKGWLTSGLSAISPRHWLPCWCQSWLGTEAQPGRQFGRCQLRIDAIGRFLSRDPCRSSDLQGQTAAPTGLAAQARNQHRGLWGPLASRLPHFWTPGSS